ncbi:MAG TPA: hypothetical protein VJA87_01175 [Candidatus Paceibacterota bacterium]
MLELAWEYIAADITGTLVQLFFAFTIVLMVLDTQKPPLITGILTGLALIVLGLGGSFRADLPAYLSILSGFLWLVLAWQRFRQTRT